MTIEELSGDRIRDWLDFFDNRAFADHEEWSTCYCTALYYPKPAEYAGESRKKRDYAQWLIETGRMKGYLAYEGGRVVGWVNANDKKRFPGLAGLCLEGEAVLSIVCFLVDKEYRGEGIARALLGRVVADAAARGYSVVEAYPKKKAKSEYGAWNGPYGMYRDAGFADHTIGKERVVRLTTGKG